MKKESMRGTEGVLKTRAFNDLKALKKEESKGPGLMDLDTKKEKEKYHKAMQQATEQT